MTNWLLLFQTPYDTVKYMTNNLNAPTLLGYYKFVDYIQTLFIHDYTGFIDELNKFKTILINLDDHTWVIHENERKETTFEELLALNKVEEEKEQKSLAEKARDFVQGIYKKSKIKKKDDTRNNNRR